jgi:hypothetical protein
MDFKTAERIADARKIVREDTREYYSQQLAENTLSPMDRFQNITERVSRLLGEDEEEMTRRVTTEEGSEIEVYLNYYKGGNTPTAPTLHGKSEGVTVRWKADGLLLGRDEHVSYARVRLQPDEPWLLKDLAMVEDSLDTIEVMEGMSSPPIHIWV